MTALTTYARIYGGDRPFTDFAGLEIGAIGRWRVLLHLVIEIPACYLIAPTTDILIYC
tara:strand:+ start:3346 stop:3519 length:174 start_codon:yes stop_codon:yes gene_type:complete